MIGKLNGKVSDVFTDFIIIEVGGVGYRVEGAFGDVLAETELSVYIYTHVTEQDMSLFGFRDKQEYILFEKLIKVSGVGPKTAVNILTQAGVKNVIIGIKTDDPDLIKATGVGKKTAQKIILELKSKIDQLGAAVEIGTEDTDIQKVNVSMEVIQALESLGYNEKEVAEVLKKLDYDENDNPGNIIKQALKLLSNK